MKDIVRLAIKEDVGAGDITTKAIAPKAAIARAEVKAKETGIIAGLEVAKEVFRQIDSAIKFSVKIKDGGRVKKGQVIAVVSGPARGILTGERVALNFLQHLSGVATLTSLFVARVKGQGSRILDTRKTTPGLRALEKAAVKAGGGNNHRIGLFDAILVKDNHLSLAGGIANLPHFNRPIEIECQDIAQVKEAITFRANKILLDNMDPQTLRRAVQLCKKAGIQTEASGGVSLSNVRAIAKTGVDYISIGALTHSAPALDISLKIV